MPNETAKQNKDQSPLKVEIEGLIEFTQAVQGLKPASEPKHSRANLGIFLTVLIAVSGYFVTWYIGYLNVNKDHIRDEIKEKITTFQNVTDAISDLRFEREKFARECIETHSKISQKRTDEMNLLAYSARLNIVKASLKGLFVFGPQLEKSVVAFVKWDRSVKNPCDKTAPSEYDYQIKHRSISQIMANEIRKSQERLLREYNFLK